MMGIHTNTCNTQCSLQIFFIHNKNIAVLQWKHLLNPTLTSLEEAACALFIQKIGDPAQGGRKSQGDRPLQLKESQSMLIWSRTKPTCQSGGWLSWHINPHTDTWIHRASRRAHMCGGEREGAIPHKGCWRSTLDLSRSPPLVKDLSHLVNLVHIWLISIKSAENSLIYDFGFAPLFINLLIKIVNNWFFGAFWPEWGKITKN